MDWADTITPGGVGKMVERVDRELDGIVVSIAARTTGFAEKYRTDRRSRGTLGTRVLWRFSERSAPKLPFFLDTDACTRCGICRDLCPSGRIVFEIDADPTAYPSWPLDRECYYCYGCFNFCPEQAIGVKHYTRKDGRYHYPGITPADIAPAARQPRK
jgi:ferredoxin